jgi:tagatose 1,6-diphosphate aldolase
MFLFHDPGQLIDNDLELVLTEVYSGNSFQQEVPAYHFRMTRASQGTPLGEIELRIGNTSDLLLYVGHIGYGVHPEARGHRYAARSIRLLLPLARSHDLTTLWITCNPDNWASRRTCELAGFTFVETVDLPPTSKLYQADERQKCRFRLELGDDIVS